MGAGRFVWRDKGTGPLPPALLTNAFANPLEVCAAGGNHYHTSPPLLQQLSLCCAKMPESIVDDGEEVMATANWCAGSPRRLY